MAQFPALPLFTDAYMADTRHLNAAQHGAYLLLLMTAWRMPDCKLPNDDKFLARCASTDLRVWKATTKDVVMGFWKLGEDGKWGQDRLLDERNFVEAKRNKNAAAGKSSALKRLNRDSTVVQPNVNQNSTPTPTPIEVVEDTTSPQTPKSDERDALLFKYVMPDGTLLSFEGFFERMWLLYPNLRDRGHKGKARDQMLKKLNEGVTYETIGRGVSKYRDYCQATGELQPDFFRWLRDDGFTRPYDIPAEHRNKPRGADRGAIIEQQTKAALIESAQRLGLIDG